MIAKETMDASWLTNNRSFPRNIIPINPGRAMSPSSTPSGTVRQICTLHIVSDDGC